MTRTSSVAENRPKRRLVTRGTSTWACRLVSVSRGRSPATVVSEVRRMARKRWRAASRAAFRVPGPVIRIGSSRLLKKGVADALCFEAALRASSA